MTRPIREELFFAASLIKLFVKSLQFDQFLEKQAWYKSFVILFTSPPCLVSTLLNPVYSHDPNNRWKDFRRHVPPTIIFLIRNRVNPRLYILMDFNVTFLYINVTPSSMQFAIQNVSIWKDENIYIFVWPLCQWKQ